MNFLSSSVQKIRKGITAALPSKVKERTISFGVNYLTERYLGEYTTLHPDQLNWNFQWKTESCLPSVLEFSAIEVDFKRQKVNELLADLPCEVIEGFVGFLSASIPWLDLNTTPTKVFLKDVDITLRPKATTKAAQIWEAMSASVMNSMQNSYAFANETVDCASKTNDYKDDSTKKEAVQWMAEMVEKIKSMVQVVVENITIRMEVVEGEKLVGMEIHIDKLEFFDDQVLKGSEDLGDKKEGSATLAWLTKNVQVMGLTISLDHEPVPFCPANVPDSTGTSPQDVSSVYKSTFEEVLEGEGGAEPCGKEEPYPRAIPVSIATLAGRTDIKVKIKGKEGIEGPTMDWSMHFGALHSVLSPRQLECLVKILSTFASPPASASQSGAMGGLVNRRMEAEDYRRVGQVLEQDMRSNQFEEVSVPFAEDCNFLASGDPMFHTMETPHTVNQTQTEMELSLSSLDSAGALSSIPYIEPTEAEQRRLEKAAHKARESTARAASEPSVDRSHYEVSMATISVCLLHEEPHEQPGPQWASSMQALADTYFKGMRQISTAGQVLTLKELRDRISEIVPRDHLGLLLKPIAVSVGDGSGAGRGVQSVEVDVKVNQAELVECLFGVSPHAAQFHESPVRIPEYCEIVTFASNAPTSAGPEMSLNPSDLQPALHLRATINSKTGPYGYNSKETNVKVEVGDMMTELDITMQDRLATLISTFTAPKPSPSTCYTHPFTQMSEFDVAMEDATPSNNALDLHLFCSYATARIRFPIVDLRPPNQHAPREWWGRNLHKESLLLRVEQLSVHKYTSPEQPASFPSWLEAMCSKIDVCFQEDFNKMPRLFGSIMQGTNDIGDNFNRPRVVIKSFPLMGVSLMDAQEDSPSMEQSTSRGPQIGSKLKGIGIFSSNTIEDPQFGSTPFACDREIVHGTKAFDGDDNEGFSSMFERVKPGRKREILEFMDQAMSNTSLLVEFTLPKVLAFLPDKQFLELLYNRLNNDLLLWQPQSPSSPEVLASGHSLNIQPPFINPDMMKSCYESRGSTESDSEDELNSAMPQPSQHRTNVRQPSDMCLSINIGEGKVLACVGILENDEAREGEHGEVAVLAREACLFVSVGHEGNKDLRYVTFGANRAHLLHAGCVENGSRPLVTMDQLDTLTFDSPGCFPHLVPRIYRSEHTVPVDPPMDPHTDAPFEVGTGEGSEDMVTVAVRIKQDSWSNTKYFLVAAGIRGATLRYEMFRSGEGWLPQVQDLLNLKDYPIQGYVMPEVLTDLNISLQKCAVDYRPKNFDLMPLRSLLTIHKFSLAANLNTGTKYTTLKVIFDEMNLWLSNKEVPEINIERDYLRVCRMGLIEVGVRWGQAHDKSSKTLLWFANDNTELRFCADSCTAFALLLHHFIHSGDLARADDSCAEREEEVPPLNLDERTEAQNLHVQQSIADALQDSWSPPASPKSSLVKEGSRPLYFMPEEGSVQYSPHSQEDTDIPWMPPDVMGGSVEGHRASYDDEEEEEFTILTDFGSSFGSKEGEKEEAFVSSGCFGEEGKVPVFSCKETNTLADDMKTPLDWPVPETKCVVRELNLDICIYDGSDFAPAKEEKKKEEKKKVVQDALWGPPKDAQRKKKKAKDLLPSDIWIGGPGRDEDVMVKLHVFKFRLQYENYAECEEISRRLVVAARKVEIEDHLVVSPYNKLLYWPQHSYAHECENMIRLKVVWERPMERFNLEEASVRLTMQSLKCHLNQNTLMFLQRFSSKSTRLLEEDHADRTTLHRDHSPSPSNTPRRKKSVSAERAPIFQTDVGKPGEEPSSVEDDSLMQFGESPMSSSLPKPSVERPPRIDVESQDSPTFFRSFVMTRDMTVTIDYMGTGAGISTADIKTMASTAIQGVLRLENVALTLKQLELKAGYLGVAKLAMALKDEWEKDITGRQMTAVVGGIGALSIFTTLAQGLVDFLTMPVVQYKKDGRVLKGFQKGVLSLKLATQTAFLDLLKKVIDVINVCSSVCFDVLSSSKNPNRIRELSKTPKDMREGMSGAVQVFKVGISGTISDMIHDVSQQKEQKGLPGAMGYILKSMPATVCAMPVQVLSAGADQCVTGLRNEVRPDLFKEDKEKYKELK